MRIFNSIEFMRGGLDYHLARHNLLTSNLTHVDTPEYKPLELERHAPFSKRLHAELVTTQSMHMQASSDAGSGKVVHDPSVATGLDGNGVNIDREAVKIASNHIRYEVLSQLTAGSLSSLAWAANDGKNG